MQSLRDAAGHLCAAERRLRGRDHARAGDLTYGQLRSIAALGRAPEMTAGQLARAADLNPASVTATLDHLERAGIVARRRSEEDRRVCRVSLTGRGWELLERKQATWDTAWERQLAGFSDEELEVAGRVVARIADMLDALPGRSGHADASGASARFRSPDALAA